MASVELIAVGTELLLGQLTDTNTAFVARELAGIGIDVLGTHAVGDNRERIGDAIHRVLERRDGAVLTGGLGPTVDDVTKEAVCDALGLSVELYEPALQQMERFFAQIGREMRPNNRKQADLPSGSVPLDNPNGTAPGFVAFARDGRFVACMPGVPREMKPMLAEKLIPFLVERFAPREGIYTRVIHTIGIGESEIDHRIDDLFRNSENPKIAVLAHDARADVKIMAKSESPAAADLAIAPLQHDIERRLGGFVFGTDDATLEGAVNALLRKRDWMVAAAESCTGGRIAAALTAEPGSSETFAGAIVAYENQAKTALLGVDAALIAREGAVSEAVALAMARGARERLGTQLAISSTGVAGPSGGTPEKPVGLVWFAIDDAGGGRAYRMNFRGDRAAVQARATTYALGILWRRLARDAVSG
jgi:nicotinamide-nucleotide amidase